MESNNKNVVYVRRGDSDKTWKEDQKDLRRGGEGRGRHRFEGKVIRKRGLKDVTLADKQDGSKFSRNSDHRDDSDWEGGRGPGSRKIAERRWKDISEGEEGRGRVLNMKRDKDRDGSGNGTEERKELFGRGKRSVRHHKGAKGAETSLSSKLKVRVGGIVRNPNSPAKAKQGLASFDFDGDNVDGRPRKSPEPTKKRRHRLILQDNSDDDDYDPRPLLIKKDANPPRSPIVEGRQAVKEMDEDASVSGAGQQTTGVNSQGVRKSSRVPKKKVLEDFEDDVPDVGMTESGRNGDSNGDDKLDREDSDTNDDKEAGVSGGDGSESDADMQDLQNEQDRSKSKRPKSQDTFSHQGKPRSAPLTARQRTMQLGKDGDVGPDLIEFPTGLTHLSRRGGQKLTLEERQVKKAEAASRRKQVVEKAANELQATAIQKILGQDSSRKRKEERLQKQREEIEQGKKAAALELPLNSIRWTIRPEGTIVSWSEDVELPKIFSTPSKYPPARQKCAAPLCPNSHKYRDSKSNLPLCSLQCYNIIQPAAALVST